MANVSSKSIKYVIRGNEFLPHKSGDPAIKIQLWLKGDVSAGPFQSGLHFVAIRETCLIDFSR